MSDPYRVIVTGDRHWYCESLAYKVVRGIVAKHGPEVVIVEGGAEGVDWAFHVAADGCGVATERFEADWKTLGKRAGPSRNADMVAAGADLCIAVHPNLAASKGTRDCVRQAFAAGIPVWLIETEDCKPIRLSSMDVATETAEALGSGEAEVPGPDPDSLWGVIADEVERTNSAWMADHPDSPEVVRWEEAVLHLAHYARKARMHKLDLAKCGPNDLIGTLIEIGKNNFKRSHLEKELRSFMAEAVRVAKERKRPKRTRGPR